MRGGGTSTQVTTSTTSQVAAREVRPCSNLHICWGCWQVKEELYVRTTCSSGVWSDNCLAVFISYGAYLLVGVLYSAFTRPMLLKTLDFGQAGFQQRGDLLRLWCSSGFYTPPIKPVFRVAKVGDAKNSRPIRQFEAAFEGLPPSHTTACLHFFSTWNHLDHCTITAWGVRMRLQWWS